MAVAVASEEFLTWAAGNGVGFDPRFPEARSLGLLPPRESRRFWVLPDDPGSWTHFTASVLKGLDRWEAGYLWPRSGQWPAGTESRSFNERVRDVVFRGVGIPDGWAGAIRFERDEYAAVLAVLFVNMLFGWRSDDELYFIPDHGRQVVQLDHHDVLHVECSDEPRVQDLVQHMERAGYPLPTEPPDDTFKRPPWLATGPT